MADILKGVVHEIRADIGYWMGKNPEDVNIWDGMKVLAGASVWPLALIAYCVPKPATGADDDAGESSLPNEGVVESVIDGDTFVLEGGDEIDLIGVVSPPDGHPCAERARADLEALLTQPEPRRVTILQDASYGVEVDRYVFLQDEDETFVNERMLQTGNVWFDWDERRQIQYFDKLKDAEEDALEWGLSCRTCVFVGNETDIIDGDTFRFPYDKAKNDPILRFEKFGVRMLGINALDENEEWDDRAKEFLKQNIHDNWIMLTPDENADNTDGFGRLLRYVATCDEAEMDINLQMLEAGLVCAYMTEDLERGLQYLNAQDVAMRAEVGGWRDDPEFCMEGADGDDDAAGDDDSAGDDDGGGPPIVGEEITCTAPLEPTCLCIAAIESSLQEYIAFGNLCVAPFSLDGWSVSDAGGASYNFTPADGTTAAPVLDSCAGVALCAAQGSTVVDPVCAGSTVPPLTLYTDTIPADHIAETDGPALSWGRRYVWNNDEDTVLLDGPGTAQDFRCSYE